MSHRGANLIRADYAVFLVSHRLSVFLGGARRLLSLSPYVCHRHYVYADEHDRIANRVMMGHVYGALLVAVLVVR